MLYFNLTSTIAAKYGIVSIKDRMTVCKNFKIERLARLIMGLKNEHGQSAIALKSLGWMTLEERRAQLKAKQMFKTVNGLAPQRLCDIFKNVDEIHNYNLRGFATKRFRFIFQNQQLST